MLPDQKIDLWYVPDWIKQTEQQQSRTIKHRGPSNKSPNAAQKSGCLDKAQHLLPVQDRKKAKATSHHCSNSTHTADKNDPECWGGVTNTGLGTRKGQRAAEYTREGNSFQAGQWATSCLQQGTLAWDRSQGHLLRDCSHTWSSRVLYSVANKLAKMNIFSHQLTFAP